MVKSLTISQLIEQCQAETEQFRKTGHSDETFCLELFRRALFEQDETAWEQIVGHYHPLVLSWVRKYSRFHQTNEEADFFVNAAFTRMWQASRSQERPDRFDQLGKCLKYLKLCVASSIEDYGRKEERDALPKSKSLDEPGRPIAAETDMLQNLALAELWQIIEGVLKNEKEHIVARESWYYGLKPDKILAAYPEIFATTAEIHQIKRNIIKRLQRRLGTQND